MTTLSEVIRRAMEYRLVQVRVAIPARVEKYDLATQTVDVKPLIKERVVADNGEIVESLPVVASVPVAFPRGGGFFISFPLAAGDTGRLVCCDRGIDQWREKGGEVDPLDLRMHAWNGAVFEPDLADRKHALADADGAKLVVGKDGGPQVRVANDCVEMGAKGDAVEALAKAQATESRLAALEAKLAALITSYNVHMNGAYPYVPTTPPVTPFVAQATPVAATKVKGI